MPIPSPTMAAAQNAIIFAEGDPAAIPVRIKIKVLILPSSPP